MKLNNRQIEAIASEILETLNTKRDVVIKDWEDNVYPGILKSLSNTKSYKDVIKLINNPLIEKLDLDFDILKSDGFKIGRSPYGSSYKYDNITSLDYFLKIIKQGELYFYKESLPTLPLSEKIQRDIVLEGIDTQSKEELINKLIAKY